MNDLTDENREPISDLSADVATLHLELHELRQSLAALEATLPRRQQTVRKGRRVNRKMLALLVAVAVLAAATIVFGQSAVDALFVSKDGNVGIGTTAPSNKLSVAGNTDVSGNLSVTGSASTNKLSVTGTGDFSNVGIGTNAPSAKLDIKDRVLLQDSDDRNYFKDGERTDGKGLRVGALWGQYGVFADKGMGALGGADGVTLQNGGLTINGAGAVNMPGNVTAASFNGDKPPYVFEVGNKADTTNWYAVQVSSDVIKSYLGDANGGTIRINLRVNDSDESRPMTELIYIEQPDKSNNRNPGLTGWTHQGPGEDSRFVLGTNDRYDVIPHPWDWIYVRNYSSPEANRGITGGAWTGGDQYRLEFMTRPNISATVIIYDR